MHISEYETLFCKVELIRFEIKQTRKSILFQFH